eukprot:6119090-Pyramimonas_sp.AAC.1
MGWVPSELNSSDEGSRLSDPKYVPKKTLVISWAGLAEDDAGAVSRWLRQGTVKQHGSDFNCDKFR